MSDAAIKTAQLEERQRHKAILQHMNVTNGVAYRLAVWLATETDFDVAAAYAVLDHCTPSQGDAQNLTLINTNGAS